MARFRMTYEVVTQESAEQGDVADAGFCSPGGGQHPDPVELSLRECREVFGGAYYDSGQWWSAYDAVEDYRTGDSTRYAIHPPEGITPSSYRRVTRLIGGGNRAW